MSFLQTSKPFSTCSFLVICVFVSLFSTSCASFNDETNSPTVALSTEVIDKFPELNDALFGPAIQIETPEEILNLSQEQISAFKRYFGPSENSKYKSHEKVYRYLQSLSTDFKYKGLTYTASDTLEGMRGNCMSLAVITAAYSKLLDVKVEYQLVNRLPVYQEYGGIVFNARHIKTALFEPVNESLSSTQLFRNYAVIDYYPSRFNYVDGIVSEDGFFAMYYRNRSAEELGDGEYAKSYYYLLEALKFEPEHEETINNLAVLHRRVGAMNKAEELYLYGIRKAKNKLTLLRNYKALLVLQDRTEEASDVQFQLDKYEDENPFEWVRAGNEAFDQEDYEVARNFYKKAIIKAPYLHQAHFGIAKVEFILGNPRASKAALNKALEEAFDLESKSIYEAKIDALNREYFN